MKVVTNLDNLEIYLKDPYKTNCIAKFFKGHCVMNDECARISKSKQGLMEISIGNGNHERDFDSIRIITQNNSEIIRIEGRYEEYFRGYGDIYVCIKIPPHLSKYLPEKRV